MMMKSVGLLLLLLNNIQHVVKGFSSPILPHRPTKWTTSLLSTYPTTIEKEDDKISIQILMSDTGGGHRASANAIVNALDVLYPNEFNCNVVDIFTEYGPIWPFNDYPAIYKIMAEYSFLWDWFYHFGATPFGLALNEFIMEFTCFDAFLPCLAQNGKDGKKADLVVSVHPLCQDLPLKILAHVDSNGQTRNPSARKTPFCTVVTDLGGAHPTWFHPNVDKCFVPTDVLYQCARDRQVQPNQLIQYGLPIRRGFWDTTDNDNDNNVHDETKKKQLRTKLGMNPDLPAVLLVGGGDGMGGIVDIAQSIVKTLNQNNKDNNEPSVQIIVVCGKNERARQTLQQTLKESNNNVVVNLQGFVNNMNEWMQASDILLTKAGPGTIAEASICGLPTLLFSHLPGQEEGNIPFVEKAGFGTYSPDPNVLAQTVQSWLSNPDEMKRLQTNAFKAARPKATLQIARDLAKMAFETKGRNHEEEKETVKQTVKVPIEVEQQR